MNDRLTVDTITSDALDTLHEQLAKAGAAIARAHALADRWDSALAVDQPYAQALLRALGPAPRCERQTAGPDHPVNDLWEALVSEGALTSEAAVDLIRRYYDDIHGRCCPYDHTPVRPGYAAAANRAALDEIRQAPAELVHTDPEPQASEPLEVDEQPACSCTYGQRCSNCRD